MGEKRSVIRSIRIPCEVDESLQREAEDKNLSVNSLVSSILTKHVEFDVYSDKIRTVNLPREVIRAVYEAADEKELRQTSLDLGYRLIKDFLTLWHKETSLNGFLEFILLTFKYSNQASVDLKVDGGEYTLVLRHEMGEKYSKALGYFLNGGLNGLFGVDAAYEFGRDQLVIRFSAPQRSRRVSGPR
jgi:hypothetical protein